MSQPIISSHKDIAAQVNELFPKVNSLQQEIHALYEAIPVGEDYHFHSFQLQFCAESLASIYSKLIDVEEAC